MRIRFVAAALLLAACAETTAPRAVCDDDLFVPPAPFAHPQAITISSLAALSDGTLDFYVDISRGTGLITVQGYVQCTELVDLAPAIAPNTHTITIIGTGGFTEASVIDCDLTISKLRDWELTVFLVTLFRGSLKVPYLQQTKLIAARIEENPVEIGATSRFSMRDTYVHKSDWRVGNALQFTVDGGAIESSSVWLTGYSGPNSFPGPITFNDFHMEFANVFIDRAHDVTIGPGYALASNFYLTNSTGIHLQPGTWIRSSDVHIDGHAQAMGCRA